MTVDFVFPDRRLFPISCPNDITKAIESYHLFRDEVPYEDFCYRLARLAELKGHDFLFLLPAKIKKLVGLRKENRPEGDLVYKKSAKKKNSRFIHWEREEE